MTQSRAAVILIGDELLSGRTRDVNLGVLARFLGDRGIEVGEAAVVADREEAIVEAVNRLRGLYAYVFTTGGIGPTHDDITARSVARAFGRAFGRNREALAVLEAHYAARYGGRGALNAARARMADMPEGVDLIANPVSGAPGFQIENVFVLAGVPRIMEAMLDDLAGRLKGGVAFLSRTVHGPGLAEGEIAEGLRSLQEGAGEVKIGSYPYFSESGRGVRVVLRGREGSDLERLAGQVSALIRAAGAEPEEEG